MRRARDRSARDRLRDQVVRGGRRCRRGGDLKRIGNYFPSGLLGRPRPHFSQSDLFFRLLSVAIHTRCCIKDLCIVLRRVYGIRPNCDRNDSRSGRRRFSLRSRPRDPYPVSFTRYTPEVDFLAYRSRSPCLRPFQSLTNIRPCRRPTTLALRSRRSRDPDRSSARRQT